MYILQLYMLLMFVYFLRLLVEIPSACRLNCLGSELFLVLVACYHAPQTEVLPICDTSISSRFPLIQTVSDSPGFGMNQVDKVLLAHCRDIMAYVVGFLNIYIIIMYNNALLFMDCIVNIIYTKVNNNQNWLAINDQV